MVTKKNLFPEKFYEMALDVNKGGSK